MSEWQSLSFKDAVDDVSGGNKKTPQKEYVESGKYPVVDQGKELIGGYTDEAERLCKAELPVVIFGDHTRCFKYIDFPFCMGADGVKVLRPKVRAHGFLNCSFGAGSLLNFAWTAFVTNSNGLIAFCRHVAMTDRMVST